MRTTTSARNLTLALTMTLASASGVAFADPEPQPTQADKAQAAAKSDNQPAQNDASGNTDQPETAEGAAETAGALPGPDAGAFRIARWMRSIGGRISIGPRLDSRTRVSRPSFTDVRQGWRVSVPTFGKARMSAPPRRTNPIATPEQTTSDSQEQTLAAAESADTPD